MHYYLVAINIRSIPKLPLLSYASEEEYSIGEFVVLPFRKQLINGIIFSKIEEPKLTQKILKIIASYSIKYPESTLFAIKKYSELYNTSYHSIVHTFLPPVLLQDKKLIGKWVETFNEFSLQDKEKQKPKIYNEMSIEKIHYFYKKLIETDHTQTVISCPYPAEAQRIYNWLKQNININIGFFHRSMPRKEQFSLLKKFSSGEITAIITTLQPIFFPFQKNQQCVFDQILSPDHQSYTQKPLFDNRLVIEILSNHNVYFFGSTYYTGPSLIALHKEKQYLLTESIKIPQYKLIEAVLDTEYLNNKFLSQNAFDVLDNSQRALIILNHKGEKKYYFCLDCKSRSEENTLHCPQCKSIRIKVENFGLLELFEILKKKYPHETISVIHKDQKLASLNARFILATSYALYLFHKHFDSIIFIHSNLLLEEEKNNSHEIFLDKVQKMRNFCTTLYIQNEKENSFLQKLNNQENFTKYVQSEIKSKKLFHIWPFSHRLDLYSHKEIEELKEYYIKRTKKDLYLYEIYNKYLDEFEKYIKIAKGHDVETIIQIDAEYKYMV